MWQETSPLLGWSSEENILNHDKFFLNILKKKQLSVLDAQQLSLFDVHENPRHLQQMCTTPTLLDTRGPTCRSLARRKMLDG